MSRILVEMPRRVWPERGAPAVPFPWSPACSVVSALGDVRSALSAGLDTRAWNALLVTAWEGAYRDEYDRAYARLCAAAGDLVAQAGSRAQAVADAADDANGTQARHNERASSLVPTGAG
jgi:uncharacterized protein YukE